MKFFRTCLVALVIVGALELVKWLMDSISGSTLIFHRSFLFTLQVLVIAWLVVMLVLLIFRQDKSWTARFLPVILALLVIGADMWFNYLLERPEKIGARYVPYFSKFYHRFEKNDIRFEPCTVYDSVYGLRIIPGLKFTYGNIEYNNEYKVNSVSFRDAEADLFGPAIVCAGNAFTFGVGVDERETYVEHIQEQSGKVVANAAAISGNLGKVLAQLQQVDTSVLEWLVVQYSDPVAGDDLFRFTRDSSGINSVAEFESARQRYRWSREYFPGKYAVLILSDIVNGFSGHREIDGHHALYRNDAAMLLDSVASGRGTPYQVIVFQIGKHRTDPFVSIVDSLIKLEKYASIRDRVYPLKVSSALMVEDYYELDDQLTPSGHRKIAGRIMSRLEEAGRQAEKVPAPLRKK